MLNVSEATMKSIDGVDLSYLRFDFEKHFGRKITKYEKEAGEVIKDFFERYRKEALDAGLFDLSKELVAMQKYRDRFIRARVNRLQGLFDRAKQSKGKGTLKPARYYERALENAEAQLTTIEKKIAELETTVKEGKFKPPFEENYFSRIWDTGFIIPISS